MLCAIDIGNTQTKVFLIDEYLKILESKTIMTPDLFDPDSWKRLFDELNELNPLFFSAEYRISCVSWKAFLALRVYFHYDNAESFNLHREFNPDLLILPIHSPIVMESDVPVNRTFVSGLIGVDRLLSAYAAHCIFDRSVCVVSFGTATVIDMITNMGIFFSGVIIPGIDSGYHGLISRADSLPPLSELPKIDTFLNHSTAASLYAGAFLAQGCLIETIVEKQSKEAKLSQKVDVVVTGGRAYSVSPYITCEHYIADYLVAYGLALLPKEKNNDRKNNSFVKNIPVVKKSKNLKSV